MKFKIDENLPIDCAELLRKANHDAVTVIEENLKGRKDQLIVEICSKEQRVLITLDNDFADIRTYPPQLYSGLVVLRLKKNDKKSIIQLLQRTIPFLENEIVEHKLFVVEEKHIRIRE